MSYPKALLHYTNKWTDEELQQAIITTREHKFLSDEDMRELQHFYCWMLRRKQLTNMQEKGEYSYEV